MIKAKIVDGKDYSLRGIVINPPVQRGNDWEYDLITSGKNATAFKLTLDKNWFYTGDVIYASGDEVTLHTDNIAYDETPIEYIREMIENSANKDRYSVFIGRSDFYVNSSYRHIANGIYGTEKAYDRYMKEIKQECEKWVE
jgi:hypothetical protein